MPTVDHSGDRAARFGFAARVDLDGVIVLPQALRGFEIDSVLGEIRLAFRRIELEGHGLTVRGQVEFAEVEDIPVIDGFDYVQNLRGEMDYADGVVLRDLVIRIVSARLGRLALDDDTPSRMRVAGAWGDCPKAHKLVPVEELTEEDLQGWWSMETLETISSTDHPVVFVVEPTYRVTKFLGERDHS